MPIRRSSGRFLSSLAFATPRIGWTVVTSLGAGAFVAIGGACGSDSAGPPAAPPANPDTTPFLAEPAARVIDEEVETTWSLETRNYRTFTAEGLPPGARFDSATGTIVFRPDFTQSGDYDVTVTGYAGGPPATTTSAVHVRFTVRDSIAPRPPVVTGETAGDGFRYLTVQQTTDAYLDSPGNAGRTIEAVVTVPTAATTQARAPLVVWLHGFGSNPSLAAGSASTFVVAPHDPDDSYWWGYADSLPGASAAAGAHVLPYTMRRVVHLMDWVRRTFPEADPDRVFASGVSMGGAGALVLGLLHGRHFAGIDALVAPTIAKNHRPSRVAQLTPLWGAPAMNLDDTWDTLDVTRMLRDLPEARNQFIFTRHAKDDATIHFGAAVFPSPLTGLSFYGSLEQEHIGHLTVWDEGSHALLDPAMGLEWWDQGWSRVLDPQSHLHRRSPFPAFTRSSADDDPGDDKGNGKVQFDPESGFSAIPYVGGDTGWGGAVAGALNRFLRWDTTKIVDTRDRLVLPLRVVVSPGEAPPAAGYPTKGDLYTGPLPIIADVTPRRARAFLPLPQETVRWRFGATSGTATANADGSVTIPGVAIGEALTELVLERDPP